MRTLVGSVALIAGGGSGIGAQTAVVLAEAGASVAVLARTKANVDEVAHRIGKANGEALALTADVTIPEQVDRAVDETLNAFGRLDFLIDSVGSTNPLGQPAWEIDPSAWRRPVETNVFGAHVLVHSTVPVMLRQRSGRVLILSSPLGERTLPNASAYCAARAALNHFARTLASELLDTGVTVNLVLPGAVNTAGLQEFRMGMRGDASQDNSCLRPRAAVFAAYLLLWLCSPNSASITGSTVSLDDVYIQRRLMRFLRWHRVGQSMFTM